MGIQIRKINNSDLEWIRNLFIAEWSGDFIIGAGKIHRPENLEGFIAEEDGEKVGLATFDARNNKIELVSINSLKPGKGIGTMLINEIIKTAKVRNIKKIFLVTTNDNLNAMKFYQKNGFRFVKVHPDAIAEARKIKPQIPEIGEDGIPIKDAIELEYLVN